MLRRVIVYQQPMPVAQSDAIQPRSGIRQVAHADRAPGQPLVARFRHAHAPTKSVLTHVGHQRPVVAAQHGGLDVAPANQRRTGIPRFAAVVRDGHDRDGKRVGVQRQQDPTARQHRRLAARLPSQTLVELRVQPLAQLAELRRFHLLEQVGPLCRPIGRAVPRAGVWKSLGLQQDQAGAIPLRRPGCRILARHAVIRQARLPAVGHDRRPEQPQALLSVDHHARVAVRETRACRPSQTVRPRSCSRAQSRTVHRHIVGRALARSAVPGREQLPARDTPRCPARDCGRAATETPVPPGNAACSRPQHVPAADPATTGQHEPVSGIHQQ